MSAAEKMYEALREIDRLSYNRGGDVNHVRRMFRDVARAAIAAYEQEKADMTYADAVEATIAAYKQEKAAKRHRCQVCLRPSCDGYPACKEWMREVTAHEGPTPFGGTIPEEPK